MGSAMPASSVRARYYTRPVRCLGAHGSGPPRAATVAGLPPRAGDGAPEAWARTGPRDSRRGTSGRARGARVDGAARSVDAAAAHGIAPAAVGIAGTHRIAPPRCV